MPEIGYWKYIRFVDDEKQYIGTDDDIPIVFDSADDRLAYRMKKDIRYEDDAGNEILTLDKANRHVEIPVQLNVAALEEYVAGAGITVKGTLTFSGANLDLAGNRLKNPKLGTDLKTGGYSIYRGDVNSDKIAIGGGSSIATGAGANFWLYGTGHSTNPGRIDLVAGRVNNAAAAIYLSTANTVPTILNRIIINQGDDPDIDILNGKLDFHDQTLEATAGASAGYFRIRVNGTEYKVQAFALT